MNKIYLFFILLFSLIELNGCKGIKYENVYLPENFTGNVAIIYSNSGSLPKETNNLIIPASGILYSSTKFVAGNYITRYSQKNNRDSFDTLSELLPDRLPDSILNQIVFPRIMTFQKYHKEPEYTVYTFYVGKKTANELSKIRLHFERELEKMLLK